MNRQTQSPPPPTNTPHGSASDRTHLEWVLKSQNEMGQTLGELKSDSRHISEALKRIEDGQKALLSKIEDNEKNISKINTRLIVFTAVFTTAIAVAGFFINGQATKTFEFMEKISKTELKK